MHAGLTETTSELASRIDVILPQTQCTRCGYSGCQPYAQAIARGLADFNQCPPGGKSVISRIAAMLKQAPKELNPEHGEEQARHVALVDERACIGCTLCIKACPVDAIIGAPRLMHTVITSLCSGCDLCLPPCPVSCITMVPAKADDAQWTPLRAAASRERFDRRNQRLRASQPADPGPSPTEHGITESPVAVWENPTTPAPTVSVDQELIRAALSRARARKAAASALVPAAGPQGSQATRPASGEDQ